MRWEYVIYGWVAIFITTKIVQAVKRNRSQRPLTSQATKSDEPWYVEGCGTEDIDQRYETPTSVAYPTNFTYVQINIDVTFEEKDWYVDDEWRELRRSIEQRHLPYAADYLRRIPLATVSQEHSFRGAGMSHHRGNWAGMYRKLRRPRGGEVATYAVLVPEPDNRFDRHAVSICVHGRHIGYVPSTHSEAISRFVNANGGLVKCVVVLWFDPKITKNSIRVHMPYPPTMQENFRSDLEAVRWISPRYRNQLIGFVKRGDTHF